MAAVQAYLSGAGSQTDIAQKYHLRSDKQLRNWIKVYHTHGTFSSRKKTGGGGYMRKAHSTTQEERIQIARECIALGKNYGEIALKYEVSYRGLKKNLNRLHVLFASANLYMLARAGGSLCPA